VVKLNPEGTALEYSTYLGGSLVDVGTGIAADAGGNAVVTGFSWSRDFPLKDAWQSAMGDLQCPSTCADAFVAKLNSSGGLVYSTYLGGSGIDASYGVAVDPSGNAYVAGITYASDFPSTKSLQPASGGGVCWWDACADAFVAKLDLAGRLVYASYLGGSSRDGANGIAVDASGNVVVTGFTASENFPTASATQARRAGNTDGFVARLNASGTSLLFSTYVGQCPEPDCLRWASWTGPVALDGFGNLYVAGGVQDEWGGCGAGGWCSTASSFITKIDVTEALALSTSGVTNAASLAPGLLEDKPNTALLTGNPVAIRPQGRQP
jgi:hypothetical protein